MSIYLDKLKSVLNNVQAKQLTALLIDKKNSGAIQNLEEVRTYLNTLTNKILSSSVSPSLQLFLGQLNQIIDSESYNFMLDRIKDDLEASYAELNNLDDLAFNHNNLINNIVLKSILLGIDSLESKVSSYEFLASNRFGLDNAKNNTFKNSQVGRTVRSNTDVGIYFLDPRRNQILDNDVTLDTLSERITLGQENFKYIDIKSVNQIFEETSTQSESLVSFTSNNINNIIDGARNTYWTYSILQKQINPEGVNLKLDLRLAGVKGINFIEIEPATIFNMKLTQAQYKDTAGNIVSLQLDPEDITHNTRISFSTIVTDQLILTFNQKHALYIQYEEKTINNNFNLTSSENTADVNVSNILGILQNQIKSSALLSNAFMLTNTIIPGREVQYFDYEVGFDNIRVGFAEYADASIFASDSFRVNDLHQIALKSLELRPVEISGVVSFIKDTYLDPGVNNFFHGSIEYYSVIKNFDSLDNLIDINTVPILPIGSENIFFERLVLSNKLNSDIFNTGKLLFFTYFTPDNPNIFVYRNGTLLEYIKDWIIADYPITNTILPPTGIPNSIGIKILNPNVYDIFTVSYTPVTTTTRADPTTLGNLAVNEDINTVNIIDLVGDASIRMGENNILFLNSKKNNGNTVAYSIIALVIVLRRNSENIDLSPSVSEYTFLTTSANPDKIESGFNAK